MKFSLLGHHMLTLADPATEYRSSLEQCVLADQLGFDRYLHTEHHASRYGGPGIFAQLGAFAQATTNIRIGPMVVLTTIHHPLLIAEELAVVDILSEGRLDVGLGRGYRPHTMELFGRDMDDLKDVHEEVIDIVRAAWTEERLQHEGRFYSFHDVEVVPKPVQRPTPPILQPVLSPPSIEYCIKNKVNPVLGSQLVTDALTKTYFDAWRTIVGEVGDPGVEVANQQICIVDTTMAGARDKLTHIKSFCREFAQDLPDFPGSVWEAYRNDLVMLADNLDEAARRSIVGDPSAVIDRLRFYEELGVEHMILFMDFGMPQEDVLKSMRLFADEVMPHFAGTRALGQV